MCMVQQFVTFVTSVVTSLSNTTVCRQVMVNGDKTNAPVYKTFYYTISISPFFPNKEYTGSVEPVMYLFIFDEDEEMYEIYILFFFLQSFSPITPNEILLFEPGGCCLDTLITVIIE